MLRVSSRHVGMAWKVYGLLLKLRRYARSRTEVRLWKRRRERSPQASSAMCFWVWCAEGAAVFGLGSRSWTPSSL